MELGCVIYMVLVSYSATRAWYIMLYSCHNVKFSIAATAIVLILCKSLINISSKADGSVLKVVVKMPTILIGKENSL